MSGALSAAILIGHAFSVESREPPVNAAIIHVYLIMSTLHVACKVYLDKHQQLCSVCNARSEALGRWRTGLRMELKIARRIARLSQQELARRAGFDVNVIIQIEGGDRDILYESSYRSVVHLAQVAWRHADRALSGPAAAARAPDAERSTGAADRPRGSRRCLKHLSAPSIRFPDRSDR